MRTSSAALALITRVNSFGNTEYLTQWNDGWNAYSIIGGHVEDGETFQQCCIREVAEEIECDQYTITAAPYPYASLRFREFSRAAKVETDYHWQAFHVRIDEEVLQRLPGNCAWIAADRIRARFTTDGKPIAEQVYRVLQAVENAEFDLFVSYGHADNLDGSVTALIEHIRQEHALFAPNEPLKIFFDLWGIRDGEEWERRIYRGLIESKTMLAVLSPAYFASEWCRREYDAYVQQQLKHTYPGELIHAIYIHQHQEFEGDVAHPQRAWFDALKKKQFLDAKPWWPDGRQALQREVVVGRLKDLREKIWERVCHARTAQHSPTNLRDFNLNFVGREQELTQLWKTLRLDHAVAVSAIQGVGGLGKTALARAYAHSRRRDYPGGQFEIGMENITTVDGLKFEIISLANMWLAAGIPDELINTNLAAAFAKARAAFERPGQGKILLILDDVASDGVLSDRSRSLPSSEHVHVLATTRLDPQRWGIQPLRLEQLSTADALDLFLKYRPFQIPDEQQWHQARQSGYQPPIDEPQPADTAEWKAALGIVNRLGGHALAIEVVAVYLGNHRSISLQDYLGGLIRKGTTLKLDQAGDDPNVRARLAESIETNIAELLKPTFEKLESENPLAMRALEWAALLPPDHVPWVWLRELVEQDHGEQLQHDADDPDPWQDGVVPLLRGWQLLTGDEDQPTARIHRIVQAAIVACSAKTFPNSSPDTSGKLDRLLYCLTDRAEAMNRQWGRPGVNWELTPHFESVQLLLPELGVRVGPWLGHLTEPLCENSRLLKAVKLIKELIVLQTNQVTLLPPNTDSLNDLSVSCRRLGLLLDTIADWHQACEYYRQSLEIRKKIDEISPQNSSNLREFVFLQLSMATAWANLDDLRQAIDISNQAFITHERLTSCMDTNADFDSTLHHCFLLKGQLLYRLNCISEAEDCFKKAFQIVLHRAAISPTNAFVATQSAECFERLADVYSTRALGNEDQKALSLLKNALTLREMLYDDRPDATKVKLALLYTYCKTLRLLSKKGNTSEARELNAKAMKLIEFFEFIRPEGVDNALVLFDVYLHFAILEQHDQAKLHRWFRRANDLLQWLAYRGLHVPSRYYNLHQQLKQIIDGESA